MQKLSIQKKKDMLYDWTVYLVLCNDNSFYCGIAKDVKKRITAHNTGKGAKYTRSRRPVKLVAVSGEMTKARALKLEYLVKQLPKHEKLDALKEETVKNLNKDLKEVVAALKKMAAKLEKSISGMGTAEKKSPAKKAKPASKAKPVKKAKAKAAGKKSAPRKKAASRKETPSDKAKTVQLIYDLRKSGKSLGDICKHLVENNIPTLSGKGKWFASTIANILKK